MYKQIKNMACSIIITPLLLVSNLSACSLVVVVIQQLIQHQAQLVWVSIDAMTSVPVVNGSATKGTLYIHNYGNKPVTSLSFWQKCQHQQQTKISLKCFRSKLE